MSAHEHLHLRLPDKLRLYKSPVVQHSPSGDGKDWSPACSTIDLCDHDDQLPEFERHPEPTLLELFFDLFFAANYSVFSDTHEATDRTRFKAYIGYFCLLWLTWFLVSLFDVRYATDSIFSRVTRALQLGVLVGFAVVAPKFDPTNQHSETMQSMSLILMFSRTCLAIEYGTTLWHVRMFKKARLPICLQIAVHLAAAMAYLGVSFAFKRNERSGAYMTWYFVSGSEAILTLLLSNSWLVLSLTKTHLMKRTTLLTVMIIGDGIIQVAKEVVTIVKHRDAWNGTIIGLLAAAGATIYIVFLVYFDWLNSSFYLPAWRQQLWVAIHLPFHLCLVLFTQGFTKFFIWSKVVDTLGRLRTSFPFSLNQGNVGQLENMTSQEFASLANTSAQLFFKDYPPKIQGTLDTVNAALANFTKLPDGFWPKVAEAIRTNNLTFTDESSEEMETFISSFITILVSKINTLLTTFGINLDGNGVSTNAGVPTLNGGSELQVQVYEKAWNIYYILFAYTYAATGGTLLLMAILNMVARTRPYTTWPVIRLVIVSILALGTGLTGLLYFNEEGSQRFLSSAWVLPTITLAWTFVIIITHVDGKNFKGDSRLLRSFTQPHIPVSIPPVPDTDRPNGERPRSPFSP